MVYPPETLKIYPFLKENKYFEYVINLSPLQIREFGKNNIVTLNFRSNIPFKVYLTNSQIKKIEVAKKLNAKIDLKFSNTQFKKTLPYVNKINRRSLKEQEKVRLKTAKIVKAKRAEKISLQKTLDSIDIKNAKKIKKKGELGPLTKENAKKLKSLETKRNIDIFVKDTLRHYKEPKPKPKKKITDVIKFPKLNII